MNHTYINGVRVFSFPDHNRLIEFADKEKKSLIAINAEKILHANERTRSLINKNIGYTDGFGAVIAMKRKGFVKTVKIAGVDLWQHIVEKFWQEKSFYLIGSKDEVINETVSKLKSEYPGIRILGYRNGYINNDSERTSVIQIINELKPDIVFVAMGSPKQELLMQDLQAVHPALYQGLGGSFDVYVGKVERAPDWWVRHNLEWAYRLILQPQRIKRQIHLVRFFFLLFLNRL